MGTPTGVIERRIKPSGRSAEHFGYKCDICAKHCGAFHMQQVRTEWKRATGAIYFSGWLTYSWGHEACLRSGEFADAPVIEPDVLPKPNNYLLLRTHQHGTHANAARGN